MSGFFDDAQECPSDLEQAWPQYWMRQVRLHLVGVGYGISGCSGAAIEWPYFSGE